MTPELLERGRVFKVFCEEILGVHFNPAQNRWADSFTEDGEWTGHGSVWISANQVGKSLGVACLILWATVYKIGIPHGDPKLWLLTPYQWFHVAPTQQQAYIPLRDIELLVKNAHPAQEVGRERFGLKPSFPEGLVRFQKMENYYDGFETVMGGAAQFRTTEEKAKALQGRRAHGISFDEAAFEIHLISVLHEALMMRLISTGGPLIIVSTPNGINDFYELVEGHMEKAHLIPDTGGLAWKTDEGWSIVRSTVYDNDGYGLSHEEILRKEEELDPATKDQQLRGEFLTPSEAFFVPQPLIVQAFDSNLPHHTDPEVGHAYVSAWDPSIASDPTAAFVIDVTSIPWKGVSHLWDRKPSGLQVLVSLMFGQHHKYGVGKQVLTVYDSTGMGGKIITDELRTLQPKQGIDLGGSASVKLNMLTNLRAALMTGKLVLPGSWTGVKREILNYRLEDKNIQNDRVIALAMAAQVASKGYGGSTSAQRFDVKGKVVKSAWR